MIGEDSTMRVGDETRVWRGEDDQHKNRRIKSRRQQKGEKTTVEGRQG